MGLIFWYTSHSYRYEAKAHEYEEIPILPSFYLPKYNCFVLVKEQFLSSSEVTDDDEEQLEEIKLLSLYTGKEVYILVGEAWLPGEPGSYSGYIYYPAAIYTHLAGQTLGSSSTNEVQASLMVKLILQKLKVNSPRLLTAYSTARKGRFEEFF